MPQVPDYLGYVLGLMLIWLAYTGYSSVVGMIQSPDSTISKIVVQTKDLKDTALEKGAIAKEKVTSVVQSQLAATDANPEAKESLPSRARLREDAPYDPEKGWFWAQLDRVNEYIVSISVTTNEYLQSLFAENGEGEESVPELSPASGSGEQRNTIEYF